jgi:hypothetical protein
VGRIEILKALEIESIVLSNRAMWKTMRTVENEAGQDSTTDAVERRAKCCGAADTASAKVVISRRDK